MSLILLFLGIIVIITGYEGTFPQLLTLLGQDGPGFIVWAGAIALIGAIGYIPEFEGVSNALLALVLIVILISNQGAFSNLQAALQPGAVQAAAAQPLVSSADTAAIAAGPTVNVNLGVGSSSGGSNPLSSIPIIGSFL